MAKKKKSSTAAPPAREYNRAAAPPKDKPILELDTELIPIVGGYGIGVEHKQPEAYAMVDTLDINRSASFLTEHKNIIDAIRSRLGKLKNKKFIIKRVDQTKSRIWRVADDAVTRRGGRQVGGPAKREKKQVTHNNGGWSDAKQKVLQAKHAIGVKGNEKVPEHLKAEFQKQLDNVNQQS